MQKDFLIWTNNNSKELAKEQQHNTVKQRLNPTVCFPYRCCNDSLTPANFQRVYYSPADSHHNTFDIFSPATTRLMLTRLVETGFYDAMFCVMQLSRFSFWPRFNQILTNYDNYCLVLEISTIK